MRKINYYPILKVNSLHLNHFFQVIKSIYLDTIFDVKRLIGWQFHDLCIQQDIKHFPFKIFEKNSKPIIQINIDKEETFFTPEEILALILGKMREIAVS